MKSLNPVKILLVDDHALIRKGIMALLQNYNDSWELFEAGNGIQGVLKARQVRPDIILMDYIMPKLDGLKAAAMIKKELPGTQIIIVTMDMRPELIMESIEAGISGIVPKQAAEIELLSAITDINNGLTHLTGSFPGVKNAKIKQKPKRKEKKKHTRHKILTDHEIEIISFLAMGLRISEIAEKLVISVRTVGAHKSKIFKKCHVHSTPELIRFALRNKIIEF